MKLSLFEKILSEKECLDIDADLKLINHQFLRNQTSNIHIRIMTSLITNRDIKINQHQMIEYIIYSIYIAEINEKDEKIRVMFKRELYVINVLKANVLIDNNIMSAKDIFIDLEKRTIIIDSCNVIVFIKIRISHDSAVQKSVYLRKIIVVSSQFEQTVKIYHLAVFINRNYLFKSVELNYLIIYAHIIDVIIKTVIIRNDFNTAIYISQNH